MWLTLIYLVPVRGVEPPTFALRIQILPISACFASSHGMTAITNKIIPLHTIARIGLCHEISPYTM